MKHSLNRLTRFGLAALLAAVMMLSMSAAVFAEDKTEEAGTQEAAAADPSQAAAVDAQAQNEAYLIEFAQSVTASLAGMDEAQIEELKESTDDFTVTAVTAWDSNRKELGAIKDEQPEDNITVELSEDQKTYTLIQKAAFEEYDADFTYTFNAKDGTPQDLSINVDLPMSVNLQRAGLNTIMGLLTVFVMLVFLSFVISLFNKIPKPGEKKAEAAPAAPAAQAAAPAASPAAAEETDDQELIAVIAAAIAAAEGTSPDGFVVRSIRKAGRTRR